MQNKQIKLISPIEALTQGSPTDSDGQQKIIQTLAADNNNTSQQSSQYDFNANFIGNADVSHAFQATSVSHVKRAQRQGMRLNNYNLMVKFEDGNQISEVPVIYPLPNSPEWFLGMSNLNGQTIPVFNLKSYFNLDDIDNDTALTFGKKQMLFVIQQGENATGIIIDRLLERLDIHEETIQHNISVPNKLQECVNNTYLVNKEVWYDLNCLSFLDCLEQQIAS